MNTLKLRVYREVVENESLTTAARKLYVSQPVISAHVRSLEDAFGARLLERRGRRMVPTEAGQLLYDYACMTLDSTQRLKDQIGFHMKGERGRLRLGADRSTGAYSLPEIVVAFLKDREQVDIDAHVADHKTIEAMILNGLLDFGYLTRVDDTPNLVFEELGRERSILVARPDHPWAKKGSVSLAELGECPYIAADLGTSRRSWEDQWFSDRRIERHVRLGYGSVEGGTRAARAGLGVILMFELSVGREVEEGALVPVALEDDEWPSVSRGLVYRRGTAIAGVRQAFLKHAKAIAPKLLAKSGSGEVRRAKR